MSHHGLALCGLTLLFAGCTVAPCPSNLQCETPDAAPNAGGSSGNGGGQPGGSPGIGGTVVELPIVDGGPSSVWEDITPPGIDLRDTSFSGGNFGMQDIVVDPTDPTTVFLSTCYQGIWKSTDSGLHFAKVSTGRSADLIDSGRAWTMQINPRTPTVLYTASGYGAKGLFKTTNGGVDWDQLFTADMAQNPTGAINGNGTTPDLAAIDLDPTDPDHIIAGFHDNPWKGYPDAGIIESKDGGTTWTLHPPPAGFGVGQCPYFLGDGSTWLVVANGTSAGTWRTTDGGKNFTKIGAYANYGACQIYRGVGALYVGTGVGVIRSADNGASWKVVSAPVGVEGIVGDGQFLYASTAFPILDSPAATNRTERAPENPGSAGWVFYGDQSLSNGAKRLAADPERHIIFAAAWRAGVFRLLQ